VEAPDRRASRLRFAAAQPGQELRLVELGLTRGGCPRVLVLFRREGRLDIRRLAAAQTVAESRFITVSIRFSTKGQ